MCLANCDSYHMEHTFYLSTLAMGGCVESGGGSGECGLSAGLRGLATFTFSPTDAILEKKTPLSKWGDVKQEVK